MRFITKTIIFNSLLICFIFLSKSVFCETIVIKQEKGSLTADVENAPLIKVLEKLSKECGASVFVDKSIQNKLISAKISNLPVEKAIKRLVTPYSSVAVFSQKINKKGDKELFISDIKVFESSKGGAGVEYVNVSSSNFSDQEKLDRSEINENQKYQSPFRVPPPVPGVHAKGSYAEKAQKAINDKMIESRIKKISYMRSKAAMEESRIRREITRLKISLSKTEGEDRRELSAELSAKTRELYNLQKRNRLRLQNEERILRQLQAR